MRTGRFTSGKIVAPIRRVQQESARAMEDLHMAAAVQVPVLLTTPTSGIAEKLARTIHGLCRSGRPFLVLSSGDLSVMGSKADVWEEQFARTIDAAADGTLFVADLERLSASAQKVLFRRLPDCRARVLSGVTIDLHACVEAGEFSAELFYRLNTIHIHVGAAEASDLLQRSTGDAEA